MDSKGCSTKARQVFIGASGEHQLTFGLDHAVGAFRVKTGHGANRTTHSATLPTAMRSRPVRPWVPITISPTSSATAVSTIRSKGRPNTTRNSTGWCQADRQKRLQRFIMPPFGDPETEMGARRPGSWRIVLARHQDRRTGSAPRAFSCSDSDVAAPRSGQSLGHHGTQTRLPPDRSTASLTTHTGACRSR